MRVLFDARVLSHKHYTGVENYAKNILDNMVDNIEIQIAKPATNSKYLAHLWTHFVLPLKRCDLLFCPANIAPIFVPKSKKLVITIHDVSFITYPESFSPFFRLYYRFIVPINIRRADKIITVSHSSKSEIERYYPASKGKIEVVHLAASKMFKKLDIAKKEQLLYVGSLNERKNFTGVIEAFKLLNTDRYRLVVVGNFSSSFALTADSKAVLDEVKNNPHIDLKQSVDNSELVKIYNESKLFVFPSFYEGFGLPLLEAMSCGTPVITSNTTSLPEVGGSAAIYCNPSSPEEIRDKIELVLSSTKVQQSLIKRGLKRAQELSWRRSALRHQEVFTDLLRD